MKTIKLSMNDLRDIVYEVVYKCYSKLPLNEYFVKRSKFVDNVWHLSYQIIENWCLVHYCTLVGRTELKEHWKDELIAHLTNIGRDGIKANNSVGTRMKAIAEGFDYASLYDGSERILQIVQDKFKQENINIDDAVIQTVKDCSQAINDIAKVIAEYHVKIGIREYVNTI